MSNGDLTTKLKKMAENADNDKDKLLEKLRDETITRDEALLLRDILEEEKKKAEDAKDTGLILAIIPLIALVEMIVDILSK